MKNNNHCSIIKIILRLLRPVNGIDVHTVNLGKRIGNDMNTLQISVSLDNK
jgi:hypothetical protein